MDAPADYAAAARMMTRSLPAYVSYTIHSSVHTPIVNKEETDAIVVRTSDGKVVKGKRPGVNVESSDSDHKSPTVRDQPFDPACYTATAARSAQFLGRPAEELTLRGTCKTDRGDQDFSRLYIDPVSHTPIAVTGGDPDKTVAVRLEQRFASVDNHVVPASLLVDIKGTGFMFWLNINVQQEYTKYSFSDKMP